MKKKKWEEEKKEKEITKLAMEKERRELIFKKREQEKKEFYSRLEEAKKKFASAQDNLEQVLQVQQTEKKVSFKDGASEKVALNAFYIDLN